VAFLATMRSITMRSSTLLSLSTLSLLLAACDDDPVRFDARGAIDGLEGGTVTLSAGAVTETFGDGAFELPAALSGGSAYEITVVEATGGAICTVENGSGIAMADVEGVMVRCASPVADLLALETSAGEIAFDAATTTYALDNTIVNPLFGMLTATVTATATSGQATITIDGMPATSGVPLEVALLVGTRTIPVVVTAGTGATKTYELAIGGRASHHLKADVTNASAFLGFTLASSADGALIAASAVNRNEVLIYNHRPDGTWLQVQTIAPPATTTGTFFGFSLAMSADGVTLVIGMQGDATDGAGAGGAYVYTSTGTPGSYALAQRLAPAIVKPSAAFGRAVAIAGASRITVGASGDSSATTDPANTAAASAGAVYIFEPEAGTGTWTQRAFLKAPVIDAGDQFGTSLAIAADGTTLAVGASGDDSSATGIGGNEALDDVFNAGAVHVFVYAAGTMTWSRQAYLKPSLLRADGSNFGSVLALDGDRVAASELSPPQRTYVFDRTGTAWTQVADLGVGGNSVALTGGRLAIGDSDDASNAIDFDGDMTNTSLPGAGAVYVFERGVQATDWTQVAYVKPPNPSMNGVFGRGLASSSAGIVIGAPGESSAGVGIDAPIAGTSANSGAVYTLY